MYIGAAAEVVRLTFDQRAGGFGVLHDFFSGAQNLFGSGVLFGLRKIDVNEFETGIDPLLGGLHTRRVIQIEVDLDAILVAVVID